MNLLEKEPVKRAERALKDFNSNLSVVILEETARTAIDASNSLKCEVGAIVKSLLFKTENTFLLCLVSGNKKTSLNKLKKNLKINDISMASADEVKSITGFTIGGVSPVGHITKLQIYIDNSLERFNYMYAAAGHPNCVFKIKFKDLQKITNGSIKEITEWDNPNYSIICY